MTSANAISPSGRQHLDDLMLAVAREIAMGMNDLPTILVNYNVSKEEWDKIHTNPRFSSLVDNEREAWLSATNAAERLKIKSATVLEDWLLDASAQLYDQKHALNHRTDLAKLMAQMAGVGGNARGQNEAAVGSRVSITINMGSDKPLIRDVSPVVTAEVIEDEE